MTATTPRPITRAAREARRRYHRDRALAQAARVEVSLTCLEKPDHGTCRGLKADGCGPCGCLCPCHDKDAT